MDPPPFFLFFEHYRTLDDYIMSHHTNGKHITLTSQKKIMIGGCRVISVKNPENINVMIGTGKKI